MFVSIYKKTKRMKQIIQIIGKGIVIKGNDIDTDRIIPARYLKETTFEKMGEYVFYDERYDENKNKKDHPFNDLKYQGASILIVNKNFGCGSSREHAPQALMRYGIKTIIGESFAEIFAGNCTMLGIPLLTTSQTKIDMMMNFIEKDPIVEIMITIESKSISFDNITIGCDMNPSVQKALLEGTWDSVSLMLSNEQAINKIKESLPYLKEDYN